MEENNILEKRKSNKGLKVLVVILIILLLGAIGYICYDKGVFDGLSKKEKVVETPKQEETVAEEKLSETEVLRLHDSLISPDKTVGLYYNKPISIDNIKQGYLDEYIMARYISDNNIGRYNDFDTHYVSKTEFEEYTKKLFNTENVFDPNLLTSNKKIILYMGKDVLGGYNVKKNKYYFEDRNGGVELIEMSSKMLKYEQEEDNLYIFDNVVVCGHYENGQTECFSDFNRINSDDELTKLFSNAPDGTVYDSTGKNIGNKDYYPDGEYKFDEIFNDFADSLKLFKHTFKKADDGNYYWYSSEIVNE